MPPELRLRHPHIDPKLCNIAAGLAMLQAKDQQPAKRP
jgi:hypothetical protein